MGKKNNRVVLLIGSGRSGSTLIDRILNLDENIIGVGELLNLNTKIFHNYCSCGEPVIDCPFWSQVIGHLKWDEEDYRKLEEYRSIFENPKRGYVFRVDNHHESENFGEYLDMKFKIYESISKASGGKIIFDSSKSPQRALNLSKHKELDLKIIYLMRDPRGTIWSFKKNFQKNLKAGIQKDMKGRSLLKSIYSWLAINSRAFSTLRKITAPTLYVSYEDFCQNPENQITRILEFITESNTGQSIDLQNTATELNHAIAGNRLRMQKEIIIKKDTAWETNLSFLQKTIIYLFTLPTVKRFKSYL